MHRPLALGFALVVCATAAAVLPSCTEETIPTTDVACSTATPSLTIMSPADGVCVPVSAGPDAYVPVVVRAKNFLIRPPGTCSGCVNCGHLRLKVNGLDNNTSATSTIDVLFAGNIASREGELELTVEAVDEDGNLWAPPTGDGGTDAGASTAAPLTSTVKITTALSCASSSSSSSSGSSSSSSSSGSSSSSSSSSSSGGGGAGGGM